MSSLNNPFLSRIPFVAVVKAVRVVNGDDTETLMSDCRRVFFRIDHRSCPVLQKEIILGVGERTIPNTNGFHNLDQY